jgi:hypothetical protein
MADRDWRFWILVVLIIIGASTLFAGLEAILRQP